LNDLTFVNYTGAGWIVREDLYI